MAFWISALLLSALVAGVVIWPLIKRRADSGAPDDVQASDVQIYRDQLSEVERDLAKGVLSEEEAERTRTEVSRRILAADKESQLAKASSVGSRGLNLSIAAVSGAVILVGAVGIYALIGAGGAPDRSLASRLAGLAEANAARPTQEEAEARAGDFTDLEEQAGQDYLDLVAELRQTAKERPDDLKGQQLLAEHEARLGRFAAARIAQERVVDILGDQARPSDITDLAELMIVAAGGYVSPQAEKILAIAITMDPADGRARYYSGLDLAQNGRPDLAFELWLNLLEEGPPHAPWIAPIRAQIGEIAAMAGIAPPASVTETDALSGSDQTVEEQQEMIRSMVTQLADRLASSGGTAEEWARLIQAYGVLGETDKAAAVWAEAKTAFSANAEAMALIRQAAENAGVAD